MADYRDVRKMKRRRDVPGLLAVLNEPLDSPDDRAGYSAAIVALGSIGDLRAVDPLGRRLQRAEGMWRQIIAASLARIRRAEVGPYLLPLLDGTDIEARRSAAEGLGWIRCRDALPGLLAMLDSEDGPDRLVAALALATIDRQEHAELIRQARSRERIPWRRWAFPN